VLVVTAALTLALLPACGGSGGDAGRTTRPTRARATTTTTGAGTTTASAASSTSTTAPATTTTTAAPGTCGGQTEVITQAIQGSEQMAPQAGRFTVTRCRVASSSPIWAAATATSTDPAVPSTTVVLERIGALWTVIAVGTSHVGCDVPAAARPELGIDC
jgi:hypothetical protein